MLMANLHPFFLSWMYVVVQVINKSRICSSSWEFAAAAGCFAHRDWAGAQAAEAEQQGLVPRSPQADCCQQRSVEQSDCVFLCLLQMMIIASKDAQMAAAYSQIQMSPWAGRSEWPSGDALCFPTQYRCLSMPFFPMRLTTPALPLSASLLIPVCSTYWGPPSARLKNAFHVYWALRSFLESEHLAFR